MSLCEIAKTYGFLGKTTAVLLYSINISTRFFITSVRSIGTLFPLFPFTSNLCKELHNFCSNFDNCLFISTSAPLIIFLIIFNLYYWGLPASSSVKQNYLCKDNFRKYVPGIFRSIVFNLLHVFRTSNLLDGHAKRKCPPQWAKSAAYSIFFLSES